MWKLPFVRALYPVLVLLFVGSCGGGSGGDDDGAGNRPQATYTVATAAGPGGSITPDQASVNRGETAEFSVTPDTGYGIAEVTGCGGELSNGTYTTAPVAESCTVTATFVLTRYTVGGSVTGLEGTLELELDLAGTTERLAVTSTADADVEVFTFQTEGGEGDAYEVSIISQPPGQTCTAENTFGEIGAVRPDDIEITCVSEAATASLSGTITPAAGIQVDSDVNDRLIPLVDNSLPTLAQPIDNRATLHGFASAEPTGGNEQLEWFALATDPDDYFRVQLEAGQLLQLQVVDYHEFDVDSRYQGDLDLYLYTADAEFVARSNSTTEFEQLVVPASGDYLVNVHAYAGISKYVLDIGAAVETDPEAQMSAQAPETQAQSDFVPNQMVVKWEPQASAAATTASTLSPLVLAHQDKNRATLAEISHSGPVAMASGSGDRALRELKQLNPESYAKTATLRQIKATRLQPGVAYAEPNYIRRHYRTPNDPAFRYQWHYPAINLPQAWERNVGVGAIEPIVAVIDSGVFLQHPDLDDQLVEGYDFIRDPDRARDGDGIDADPDDPGDSTARGQSSWHGTHVAGTVAAVSDNRIGTAGVSWGARIMPIRVLGRNGGTSYDVMQGLRYAAGLANDSGTVPERRADVANLSLGGYEGSQLERETYEEVRATGMIIVAAAGNENSAEASYPAAYSSVISVSSTDFRDERAPYSNYGNTIAVAAPGGYMGADLNGDGYGDGVLSTLVDDTSGTREPSYGFYHGTSMAAPHVAGVIALMKAVHPQLTPDEVDALLISGAITDEAGESGRDPVFGYGIINAVKSLQAAQDLADGGAPPEDPPRVAVTPETLIMGPDEQRQVVLSNEGGGDPEVTAIEADSEWLEVRPHEIDANGLGSYNILVDRSGLADGTYRGSVTFTINGQNVVTLQVYMQVGAIATPGELAQLYVLLVEEETEEVQAVVVAEPVSEGLRYEFTDIPVGRYRIIAGSDIDVDQVVCQSGESCGAYPTLDRQQPIQVDGTDMTGLDFVAQILGRFLGAAHRSGDGDGEARSLDAPLSYHLDDTPDPKDTPPSRQKRGKELPLSFAED